MRSLLVLALCALAVTPASARAGDRIAFSSDREGSSDVYTMDPDGSDVVRLTDDEADEFDPSWAPEGDEIAYVKWGAIWVMRADGSGQREVVSATRARAREVVWWPDGRRLVFAGRRGDLWSVTRRGTRLARVTDTPRVNEFMPAFSRGGRLAWVAEIGDAYRIVVDGRVLRAAGRYAFGPAWSPDGRRLAYFDAADRLLTIGADGRDRRRVGWGSHPAFSPDGRTLAVSVQDEDGVVGRIATLPSAGGHRTVLTPWRRVMATDPDWRP